VFVRHDGNIDVRWKELRMKRLVLLLVIALGWVGLALPVAAQGTPTAGASIGEPATLYDANAKPVGTVAVTSVVDPYTGLDRTSSSPNRGYHWVMATVAFTAGDAALPIASSSFQLVDSDGFTTYQSYVYRSDAATAENPDFNASQADPGQTVSGVIFFQLYNDSTPHLIEYIPTSTQLTVVADLRDAHVAPGSTVAFTGSDGKDFGTATVTGVVDPVTDFAPSSPPNRGFHYVAVGVTITNTSDGPVSVDPSRFFVVDHEGFQTWATTISRTGEGQAALPDLQYAPLDPGASASGLVEFLVINGSAIETVFFAPGSDRQIAIAEYAAGATYEPPVATPVVPPDPACADAITWAQHMSAALSPANTVFDLVGSATADGSFDVQAAHDGANTLRGLADQITALDTPAIVADVSTQFHDALIQMADQLDKVAEAAASGDAAALKTATDSFYETAFGLTGGAYSDLVARCPAVQDVQ
jgi:hypothetical protein